MEADEDGSEDYCERTIHSLFRAYAHIYKLEHAYYQSMVPPEKWQKQKTISVTEVPAYSAVIYGRNAQAWLINLISMQAQLRLQSLSVQAKPVRRIIKYAQRPR